MMNLVAEQISIKTALLISIVLLVVVSAGSFLMIHTHGTVLEENFIEKNKFSSRLGAVAIGKIIEATLDNGTLREKDFFDPEYIPIPNTSPAQYHTNYDTYLDKVVTSLEDEFLADKSVAFAVAVDVNGYLPTHNDVYPQKLVDNKENGPQVIMAKRIYNSPVEIKAAQNQEATLVQINKQDTGEVLWDISSPIYVNKKHWGAFRIGLSPDKIKESGALFTSSLIWTMFCILAISIVAIFFTIKLVLKPLSVLTCQVSNLADGDVETGIKVNTKDEIGKLAGAVERLRISLKVAMDRLSR